uniref:T-cell receptor alpha/delta variable 40.0 n=1 Tax=Sinocyclocheilus rhinocerous TaxID=307959 RepID=A0A673N5A4_9TELE
MITETILFFCGRANVTAVDKIEPNKGTRIIKTEGESVTLSCSYDSNSENVRLYWYRQYPNGEPQYLLPLILDSSPSTSRMLTELIISSVTVSDSALYYCALRIFSES